MILVAGATGGTGRQVVERLLRAGQPVRALIRRPEQAAQFAPAVETALGDLTGDFAPALTGAQAVICCVGAGMGADPEQVDHLGTVRLAREAQAAGVSRFLLVSSFGTDRPEALPPFLRPYLEAKRRAELEIAALGLPYTILKPGGLTDAPATGRVSLAVRLASGGQIPRADLAEVCVACLGRPELEGCELELIRGELPIALALDQLASQLQRP